MKRLTPNEIRFIKETGWTPTIQQCDEYNKIYREPYYIDSFTEAENVAREDFNVDIIELYNKTCNINTSDSISLEYEATYLLYTFFTKEELLEIDPLYALKWLQDFKYYFGFRKWDEHLVEIEIEEALEIYGGSREFYLQDGDVWNREVEYPTEEC